MSPDLHPLEIKVLKALAEAGGEISTADLAKLAGIDKVGATRTAYFLSTKGLATIEEKSEKFYKATDEGKTVSIEGVPEKKLLRALKTNGNEVLGKLAQSSGLDPQFVNISIGHLKRAALVELTKVGPDTVVSITPKGAEFLESATPEEDALSLISKQEAPLPEELAKTLLHRQWAVEFERKEHKAGITGEGKSLVQGGIKSKETALTIEMLRSGGWRQAEFRAFDVAAPVPAPIAGKHHPLHSIIERIRRIFLQMGFTEERGPFLESTFWCFDALFQPQDHPARDLADTFYMATPSEADVPEELVPKVKAAHEHGILGSSGWGGAWSERITRQLVLRTHTTAVSARSLAKYKPPAKIFTIDKVFRNETLDYKHLAELYQVEGIVFDENVTFRNLLGYLKEFYVNQMGFEKVRFRPAYFPYTEMSVEPEVFIEGKGWMELGGSGIFRPEVVKPLNIPS
jgi:phenylalanyl-tRNA synthetase alpha chain